MSLAVRVTCLEALGILLYSIGALAKMEGLAEPFCRIFAASVPVLPLGQPDTQIM
jgi:hypothetical protein